MCDNPLHILGISVADRCGGAEKVAWDMFREYRDRGHHAHLLVGAKHSNDPNVSILPRHRSGLWQRGWHGIHHRLQAAADRLPGKGIERLLPLTRSLSQPGKWYDRMRGHDDFRFPNTYRLLDYVPSKPDVVHCHNLHGDFFDLRALPWLCQQATVVLSLHDGWMLSGLCGHSFDCERWKTGCGQCPYLEVWQEPAWSRRDGTAYNWRRKQNIFSRCRLYVTTACRWMANRVETSILAPAVQECRVIPNGVNLAVFKPGNRDAIRQSLGIPTQSRAFFFVARGLASNPSKDYVTLRAAIRRLAERHSGAPVCFVARGEQQPPEQLGKVEIRYFPWTADDTDVASFYQAADVYVHAARMDTFPLSVLEAQACGIPVVASAVGGIPEQVKSLGAIPGTDVMAHEANATGILVPTANVDALCSAIEQLLQDDNLRLGLGANALHAARASFDMKKQATAYLDWYVELVQGHRSVGNGRSKSHTAIRRSNVSGATALERAT